MQQNEAEDRIYSEAIGEDLVNLQGENEKKFQS